MSGINKRSNQPRVGQRKLKGPADRVKDLQALRKEVLKRKPSPGYDPKMQLKDIDHEIRRLTRPPHKRKK